MHVRVHVYVCVSYSGIITVPTHVTTKLMNIHVYPYKAKLAEDGSTIQKLNSEIVDLKALLAQTKTTLHQTEEGSADRARQIESLDAKVHMRPC